MKKVIFLLITLFVSAQVTAETDMDVALEIVSLSQAGTDSENLTKTLRVALGAETEAQVNAIASEVLRITSSDNYRRDVAIIYLEMFSSEELREFRDLMKSSAWQKWIKHKHFWAQQVLMATNKHIVANQNQFQAAIENAK